MGARLPRSVARKRADFGSRPMTAKKLAAFLSDRCRQNLASEPKSENDEYITVGRPFQPNEPGVWAFRMNMKTVMKVIWHCRVNVTSKLEVFVDEDDLSGKLRVPRYVIACALEDV